MGFQNGNDNGQMQANADKNTASSQRTKNTARLAQDTSKCQYERLNGSGKAVGTGE